MGCLPNSLSFLWFGSMIRTPPEGEKGGESYEQEWGEEIHACDSSKTL
jgi:hypothetical protein